MISSYQQELHGSTFSRSTIVSPDQNFQRGTKFLRYFGPPGPKFSADQNYRDRSKSYCHNDVNFSKKIIIHLYSEGIGGPRYESNL